ncbi:Polyadenylate-binding protein [Entamoeba marina]
MTSSESQQNGSSVSNSFLDNCKLYVENISPAVTQEMFSSHIKQFFAEKCVSCEIIKEQNKMDSCVGFITMDSHESADEVIKQLNGSELCDKKLRFTWDIKDAKARNANDSNLYVKSIRKDLSIKGFDDAFRTYGSLLSTKLSTNEKGESNGYGYVRYVNSSDAKKVLEDKSVQEELKKQIGDENFVIEKYQKQKQSPYNTNIYIDNIDKDCDEKKFLEVIHSYGQILQAHQNMFAFKYDEEHECYKAFVNFSNADDAKKAIDDLNGSNKFGKNVIRATFFKNKLQRKKDFDIKKSKINTEYSNSNLRITTNVFPITEDIIHEKFDSCGEIYSISVIFVDKKTN